jgi:NAD(P)-dependent dehydrogenase (short-subunit alcohol dehydrogenase family)
MNRLQGKVAVITGGASGIGEATVRLFVAEGARVVIADVSEARGQALADELGEAARFVRVDVSREADVAAMIEVAVGAFGRLDVLFNNAGVPGPVGRIAETPTDDYGRAMDILLKGVFLGMKHAAPVMLGQGAGSIISTASVAGIETGHAPHIYSAAKAAVIHLTRTVGKELAEGGVRVNCICPGGIATPIFGKTFGLDDEAADRAVEAMKAILARGQPVRRAGIPDDIASAALFLASDESSFVSGHALVVDGGLTYGNTWSQIQKFNERMAGAVRAAAQGE